MKPIFLEYRRNDSMEVIGREIADKLVDKRIKLVTIRCYDDNGKIIQTQSTGAFVYPADKFDIFNCHSDMWAILPLWKRPLSFIKIMLS